jgi:hypothetical protein
MLTRALGTNDFVPMLYRSLDQGRTWVEHGPIWPHLIERWSIFVSISRDAAGRLYLFGSRSPIDVAGETFWSDATQGIKQNELIWAMSRDGGRSWTEPAVAPMPIAGSAESPCPLCITRDNVWLAPYSPYNTFDPALAVDRHQVVALRSEDQGRTWSGQATLRFAEADSTAAEAWLIELADGRLLSTTWHLNRPGAEDYPNAYALSVDGGRTWSATRSTGLRGQSTALAALSDGRALFIYNQRKFGEAGVWIAVVRPTATDFGVETNQIAWKAATRTQSGTTGDHAQWSDFAFGEPAVALLAPDLLLLVLWCAQPDGKGIRFVQLRIE